MVKCSNCGKEIESSFNNCPYCGNSLSEPESNGNVCSNCGNKLNQGATFCPSCGNKIEKQNDNVCQSCGSKLPNNVSFCPNCGANINSGQKQETAVNKCSNCGTAVEEGSIFCPECGMNVFTGGKPNVATSQNQGFVDKIDLNSIIKPTLVALVVSIVLSSIGLLIGLSWISFIPAVILSVGFFAGTIDNDANAIISGLFVGLILGILENPLVEIIWGTYAARAYFAYFGGQIIILIIVGIIVGYLSNMYLKNDIKKIADKHLPWL